MTDQQQPTPTSITGTIEVTACELHPHVQPTMPAATCSACGRQLHVTIAEPCQPSPDGWCLTHSTSDGPAYCQR